MSKKYDRMGDNVLSFEYLICMICIICISMYIYIYIIIW